jgi:hypothetical protein
MNHAEQPIACFLAPDFFVLRVEAKNENREYEIPLRKAYRNHPDELRALLDRIAAELDELQTGET